MDRFVKPIEELNRNADRNKGPNKDGSVIQKERNGHEERGMLRFELGKRNEVDMGSQLNLEKRIKKD